MAPEVGLRSDGWKIKSPDLGQSGWGITLSHPSTTDQLSI